MWVAVKELKLSYCDRLILLTPVVCSSHCHCCLLIRLASATANVVLTIIAIIGVVSVLLLCLLLPFVVILITVMNIIISKAYFTRLIIDAMAAVNVGAPPQVATNAAAVQPNLPFGSSIVNGSYSALMEIRMYGRHVDLTRRFRDYG